MTRYELLRILKNKFTWIAVAVLAVYYVVMTVLNGINGVFSAVDTDKSVNLYLEQFDSTDREALLVTLTEKQRELQVIVFDPENPNAAYTEPGQYADTLMGDFIILSNATTRVQYLNEFSRRMIGTVNKAVRAKAAPNASAYTVAEQDKIISQYNRVRHFSLISAEGAEAWFHSQSNFFYFKQLLLLTILVIAVTGFLSERSHRMGGMAFSTYNGRSRLFAAKLLAVVAFAGAVMVVFTCFDIVIAAYSMGAKMLGEPIQTISEFTACPFSLTFLGYILVCNALLFLILLVIIGVAAAVCTVIRNGFAAMIVTALPFVAGIAVWVRFINREGGAVSLQKPRQWLPTMFIDPASYIRGFDCVNFLGLPIERVFLCIAVSVALILITTAIAVLRFGKPSCRKG